MQEWKLTAFRQKLGMKTPEPSPNNALFCKLDTPKLVSKVDDP
jgi:hypothetical protein